MINTDVLVEANGSAVIITPLTAVARDWVAEHIESESWQWLGGGLYVDHRYAADIVHGMRENELQVSTANCWF